MLNFGPGKDDIRVLDDVLYPNAVVSGGGNAVPAPTPVIIQPQPTAGGNIFASDILAEVKDGDCRTGECGKCQGDW